MAQYGSICFLCNMVCLMISSIQEVKIDKWHNKLEAHNQHIGTHNLKIFLPIVSELKAYKWIQSKDGV